MIILSSLSSEWEITLGALGGVLLGALFASGNFTDRAKIKAALKLQDRALICTILLFLLAGVLLRDFAVRWNWISGVPEINPAHLGTILFGGLLVGIGLNLAGVTPLTALGAVGGGRLSALWAIFGMALAFPLLDWCGNRVDNLLGRWDYRLGCARMTENFFSGSNSTLYAAGALAVLIVVMALGARRGD